MATKHAWGTLKSGGGGGDGRFMKLKPDSKNKFRPLGDPVVFYRYYVPSPDGKITSAITDDPEACVVTHKHGIQPRKRAAVNVIDKQDGKLKILECAYSVFADMKTMWEGEGESPGGQDGGEFGVKVDIPNGNKKQTKYKVMCYGACPVTPEEKKMIKDTGPEGKLFNLEKEFTATPEDEIEAKLGLVASSSKSSGKASSFEEEENDSPKKAAAKASSGGDDPEMEF